MTKKMNHIEYPESLKRKSYSELYYIISDAKEAYACYPEGANASYYADEICYAVNELNRRRNE